MSSVKYVKIVGGAFSTASNSTDDVAVSTLALGGATIGSNKISVLGGSYFEGVGSSMFLIKASNGQSGGGTVFGVAAYGGQTYISVNANGLFTAHLNAQANSLDATSGNYLSLGTSNATSITMGSGSVVSTVSGIAIPTIFTATQEPTGFLDRTATLSWTDTSPDRTLTITGSHTIYINGVASVKGTTSLQIANTTGLHFIYYNTSGTLTESVVFPGFFVPYVASVYWNATTVKGIVGEERHGITMDGATHQYLHSTIGTRYVSGMALSSVTNTTFQVDSGVIDDEDISITTGNATTCDVFFKNGTADYEWNAAATALYGASLRYNNGNTATAVSNGFYAAMWVFATNSITRPIAVVIGQRQDNTIALARANNTYESLAFGTLPFKEMKLLYRVLFHNQGGTPTYDESADYRSVSNVPGGTYVASAHSALSGLASPADDHTQYALLSGRDVGQTLVGGGSISGNLSLVGGQLTTSTLTLKTTTAAGATGADIIFQVGSNGATEAMRILNSGVVTATTIDSPNSSTKLTIGGTNSNGLDLGRTGKTTTVLGDFAVNGTETIIGGTTFGTQINFGPYAPATVGAPAQNSILTQYQYAYWSGAVSVTTPGYALRSEPSAVNSGVGDLVFLDAGSTMRMKLVASTGKLLVTSAIDTTTATSLNLGTTTANAIYIGSTGITTQINGTAQAKALTIQNGGGGILTFADGTTMSTAAGSGSTYWTASSTDIYSSNSGNVGIGAAPGAFKLDVTGTSRISSQLTLSSASTTNPPLNITSTPASYYSIQVPGGTYIGANGATWLRPKDAPLSTVGYITYIRGGAGAIETGSSTATAGGSLQLSGGVGGDCIGFYANGGAGGIVYISGGSGGAAAGSFSPGAGAAISIYGGSAGTGGTGNANGGSVTIYGGLKSGTGVNGTVSVGATQTSGVTIGMSGIPIAVSGNVTITQATGTAFAVDTNVLIVDATNNRVGINMTPLQALDVTGTAQATAITLRNGGSGVLTFQDGTTQSTAAVAATNYWTASSTDIYNNNAGNVGIGGAPGSYKLDVSGWSNADKFSVNAPAYAYISYMYGNLPNTVFKGARSTPVADNTERLNADGTMQTTTGWIIPAGWAVGGGFATHTAGSGGTLYALVTNVGAYTVYKLTFTVATTTAGSGLTVTFNGGGSSPVYTGSGTYTLYRIWATASNMLLEFVASSTWAGTVTNVSATTITSSVPDIMIEASDQNNWGTGTEIRGGGNYLYSTYIGNLSGQANTGQYNAFFGPYAGQRSVGGSSNSAFGYNALEQVQSGSGNVALGSSALIGVLSGSNNIGIGSSAIGADASSGIGIGANTLPTATGTKNIAVGLGAGQGLTSGGYNICLGASNSFSLGITTGTGNVIIGNGVQGLSAALSNNIILATGTSSTATIRAQFDGTDWTFSGYVKLSSSGLYFNDASTMTTAVPVGGTNGYVPIWNSSTSKWVPGAQTGGSGYTDLTGFNADTGQTLVAGDPLHVSSNDKVSKALATGQNYVCGFAAAGASGGAAVAVKRHGILTSVLSAATAGDPVYLSAGGGFTATAPSTTGYMIQRLGWAKNTTDMIIDIGEPIAIP